jgi:radical SAM protein with 4Fe4S-binding SPASM domain
MTNETAEIIVEHIDDINISLTGITPETYHNFQGSFRANSKDLFELAIKNTLNLISLKKVRNSNCKIHVSFIVNKDSIQEAKDAIAYWKEAGIDSLRIRKDTRDGIREIVNAGENIVYRGWGYMCINTAVVSAEGDVFPCCQPWGEDMPLGNCFKTPLNNIFNSYKYFELCHKLASLDKNKLPNGCKSCGVIAHV